MLVRLRRSVAVIDCHWRSASPQPPAAPSPQRVCNMPPDSGDGPAELQSFPVPRFLTGYGGASLVFEHTITTSHKFLFHSHIFSMTMEVSGTMDVSLRPNDCPGRKQTPLIVKHICLLSTPFWDNL